LGPFTAGLHEYYYGTDRERYPRQCGPFGCNGAFWYVRIGMTF